MKKTFKSPVLTFVLGILVSGVGVYAASNILATNVTYTPSDSSWNVNNTASALDNLYDYYEVSKYVEQRDCIQGTVICDDRCTSSEGIIVTDFMPSYFNVFYTDPGWDNTRMYVIYDTQYSTSEFIGLGVRNNYPWTGSVSEFLKNNKLAFYDKPAINKNMKISYVACK